MKKAATIFLMTLIFAMLACGSTVPPSTPEPVSVVQASPVLEQPASPTESVEPEQGLVMEGTVSAPGLRVVYIRGGNLWSWTEAGGSSQLTDTGDMSTLRASGDGQLLAFIRENEIWTIRMDGTDARLVDIQARENGRLWFAPNSILLAVSTSDHIDVTDLNTGGKNTLVTYPVISEDYAPEVIWMPDSSGFKTIIPTVSDQAEMLYVFPDGTLASLAKFEMVSSPDAPYYFSPDGGYVIYTAKLEDGRESLHLMDSSGATKPYGEPGESIRAYGWFPDSKRFIFGQKGTSRLFLGQVDGSFVEVDLALPENIRWVDASHYLAIRNGELIWGDMNGAMMSIDSGVSEFDVHPVN
jgi:hypothetical protein